MKKTVFLKVDENGKIVDVVETMTSGYEKIELETALESNDEVINFIELVKGKSVYDNFEGEIIDLDFKDLELNSSREIIKEIFTNGACGRFSMILKKVFPQGKSYLLSEVTHVVTEINGKLYDINGDVTEKYKDFEMEEITDEEMIEEILDENYSFLNRGPII